MRRRGGGNRGLYFLLGFVSSLSLAFAPVFFRPAPPGPAAPGGFLSAVPGAGLRSPVQDLLILERRRNDLLVRLMIEGQEHRPAGNPFLVRRIRNALRRGILEAQDSGDLDAMEQKLDAFLNIEVLPGGAIGAEDSFDRLIDAEGRATGVYTLLARAGVARPRDFVLALIRRESAFNPLAVSPKGAIGLMQVMPETAAGLGIAGSLADPETNVRAGMLYLRDCLERFGRPAHALAAYNSGIARTARSLRTAGAIPGIAETRAYVDAILRDYRERTGDPLRL